MHAQSATQGSAQLADAQRCEVGDYLLLTRAPAGADAAEVAEALSELLGLMYAVPNIVVAFAGSVTSCQVGAQLNNCLGGGGGDAALTNALHFRFATRQAAEAFLTNSAKQGAFASVLPRAAAASCELVLQGSVAKDMDAIFRRSASEWGSGVEHLQVVAARQDSSREAADEYVSLLRQVAETDGVGALQSVSGAVLGRCAANVSAIAQVDGECLKLEGVADCALMSRFRTEGEARAFLQLPPCAAIAAGDARCPVESVLELTFQLLAGEDADADTVSTDAALL